MKFCITLLACIAISFLSYSQSIPKNPNVTDAKGHRQGKWTLLFDANWTPVTAYKTAVYYRLIKYTNDKPTGIVRDYYPSGKVQWEGTLLADRPQEIIDGESTSFRENGTKESIKIFREGALVKETYFDSAGKELLETPESLNTKGEQAFQAGKYDQALSYFIRMVNLVKEQSGTENAMYATAIASLGYMYLTLNDYNKADSLYQNVLTIREHVLGKDHKDYGSTLYSIGELRAFTGKLEEAKILYQQALVIYQKTIEYNHEYNALVLNNLGVLNSEMGDYEKAIEQLKQAIDIRLKLNGKNSMEYAQAVNNLADVYNRLGQYRKAENLSFEALEIRKAVLGEDHPYVAQSYNNLATLYFNESNYLQSEKMYLKAIENYKRANRTDNTDYAQFIGNLAVLYAEVTLYKKAEPLFDEALRIFEKFVGQDHPIYALCLGESARMCYFQGKLNRAESLYLQVLDIRKRLLGERHPYYALTLSGLANVYKSMGEYGKAEELYSKALEIYDHSFDKSNPFYIGSLNNLALMHVDNGNMTKAGQVFKDVNKGYLNQIKNYFPGLSEKEREAFYTLVRQQFEMFNSIAVSQKEFHPYIYNNQLSTKALLFNANNKIRNEILKSGDSTAIDLLKNWRIKRNELAKAYQMSSEERQANGLEIQVLEDKVNEMEKALSARSEVFSRHNIRKDYVWSDVKNKLAPGEAVVEIVKFRKYGFRNNLVDSSDLNLRSYKVYGLTDTIQYVALIVTSKMKSPELLVLNDGNLLEKRFINNYKNSIKFNETDTISYKQFWAPIGKKLAEKGAKKVFVSSDGVYNELNVLSLQNPTTGKFVRDELDVQLITSSRDLLLQTPSKNRLPRKAFLFGNPNFSDKDDSSSDKHPTKSDPKNTLLDSAQRFFAGGKLSPLPGTKTEIVTINKMLESYSITVQEYTEDNASESKMKNLEFGGVLHLATHGFFIQDQNLEQHQTFAGFSADQLMFNPLLRSGLLMAGSQKAIDGRIDLDNEDGILTAYEAMNLDLDETDLVVLSACETGLGEIRNGEGVYGLQRAFQTAGAKSVLMSLWKVDDDATQELMTAFYKNWLKSGDKRTAFKNAQASVRKKYPHPYYWGAFVLVGE